MNAQPTTEPSYGVFDTHRQRTMPKNVGMDLGELRKKSGEEDANEECEPQRAAPGYHLGWQSLPKWFVVKETGTLQGEMLTFLLETEGINRVRADDDDSFRGYEDDLKATLGLRRQRGLSFPSVPASPTRVPATGTSEGPTRTPTTGTPETPTRVPGTTVDTSEGPTRVTRDYG